MVKEWGNVRLGGMGLRLRSGVGLGEDGWLCKGLIVEKRYGVK
jgi:hypothetical protein